MLAVPFIFLVEWADGYHQYLTYDTTLDFRGRPRHGALGHPHPCVSVKILIAKLQFATDSIRHLHSNTELSER